MRTRKSTTRIAVVAVLAMSSLSVTVAQAATGDPSDLVEGCEDAPSARSKFSDYGALNSRGRDIVDCLASGYHGRVSENDFVLQGSGGQVRFSSTITRAQFATILNRVGDYLGMQAFSSNPNDPTFADVPSSNVFFGSIEELFKRGLTQGAGSDTQDVDNDGDRDELIYNPNGAVTYAQVISFVRRLLEDGGRFNLPQNQSHNESDLSCGVFQGDHDKLDRAGFLRTFNTPARCNDQALRSLVFDLVAEGLDLGVELGEITNAHLGDPGTITMTVDQTSVSTGGTITATVTVLDANNAPVQGQLVEVFGVKKGDAFTNQGAPKDPGNLSVGNTGRFGTGANSGVLDSNDPVTNSEGKAIVTVAMTTASSGEFELYTFQGDVNDAWTDVKDRTGATGGPISIAFTAVPADLVITSSADGWPLKYNDDTNVISIQVVDANAQPIKRSGMAVLGELYRRNNNGGETLFTRIPLSTNNEGVATWVAPAPNDPNTAGGDETFDRFNAIYDENGNGLADDPLHSSSDLTVRWLDAPRSTPANALITLPNENSAKNDLMGRLRENGATEQVRVFVTNIYGDPAPSANVQLSRVAPVNTGSTINGEIVFVVPAPDVAAERTYTALVDPADDCTNPASCTYTPAADVAANSVAGDQDVTIQWVNDEPLITTQYNNMFIAGRLPAQLFVYSATQRVRLLNDGNDRYMFGTSATNCTDGTSEISQASFLAAVDQDVEGNDRVDVTYQPGSGGAGQSCWVLEVISSSGPVVP